MITDGVELPDGSFRVMWNQKLKLTTPATESDELIQQLGHLTECDTVRVVDSKLTDDGFRFLRTLPQLRQVQFIRVPGTNRSARDDTQLAKLQKTLPGCRIE